MVLGGFDGTLSGSGAAHTIGVIIVVIDINLLLLIFLIVLIVAGYGVLNAVGQTVPVQGVGDILVLGNGGKKPLVDGLAGVRLLHNAENTVVQMLVELLCVRKRH